MARSRFGRIGCAVIELSISVMRGGEAMIATYEGSEGAAAHKQTAHYLQWRQAVEPWMAKPRQGVPYHFVAPARVGE